MERFLILYCQQRYGEKGENGELYLLSVNFMKELQPTGCGGDLNSSVTRN
jgi:hypothetical protein